jgi:hypothetical protein
MAFNYTYTDADFQEQQSPKFSPIPEGEYEVTITDSIETISKKSGKNMIKLTCKIIKGPYINRLLFTYITENEHARETIGNILNATRTKVYNFTAKCLLNKSCKVKVIVDDNGYNKIKYWNQLEQINDEIPMGNRPIDPNLAPPLSDEPPF